MVKMLLDVIDMFSRLTIEKSPNTNEYHLQIFDIKNNLGNFEAPKFADSPKAVFILKPESIKAFIEKVKDDLEVKA